VSLYARILLAFWAAIALVVIGAAGVTALVLMERADEWVTVPEVLGREAARALDDGGEAGLARWLQGVLARNLNFDVYVVGPKGELLGRPLPARAERRLRAPEPMPPLPGTRLLPARPLSVLIAADGSEYRLVVMGHRPTLGPLGLPTARWAVLLLALAITGAASFWLTRSITRPVAGLGAATRQLAGGRLETRVAPALVRRRDELGTLARDFDAMAQRLRALVEGKERLLADISHELRSPLARMRVALALARQSGGDVSTQLDRLETETERLDALIGQVLKLARLDARGPGTGLDAVDLGELVDGIARDAAFEAQPRGVRVDWSMPPKSVTVAGDAPLLASAVENVVRNALRYTAAGTTVTVQVQDPPAVVVRDHGPGVPESELERIFEPFHRVAEARGRDSGGDGIGLAITSRVMRAHGGSASARNCPGGGLEVRLAFAAPG
jgi:two-component system sensor histidine kinase CpxA